MDFWGEKLMKLLQYDVVIIGAGASGLMCAIEAGKRGRRPLVIDHNSSVGKKIFVSGGGHCNFTNLDIRPEHYISDNRHFVKSALSKYQPEDFLQLINKYNIKYYEKKDGQLFCKSSSSQIIKMLLNECEEAKVDFLLDMNIKSVEKKNLFTIHTSKEIINSDSLVIASGGLSYKELGASNIGHMIAKQFGLKITEIRPALVPLCFGNSDKVFKELSGISVKCRVSCGNTSFTDDMLFTHKGLSGPAILQISSYWQNGETIKIDLFTEKDIYNLLLKKKDSSGKVLVKNYLSKFLTKRLSEIWCQKNKLDKNIASYSDQELKNIAANLHKWEVLPSGTAGFEKAEATRGGIDTKEISSKTMQTSKTPGLFFIGEVLDVVGHLGGYNLHWAWASGHTAGQFA